MTALRVVHVSYSDLAGGAARAAWRLHRAMLESGLDSWMLVVERLSEDERVLAHRPASRAHRVLRRWIRPRAYRLEERWSARDQIAVSVNVVPSGILHAAEALRPDIVNLHWIGRETASIEELGRVRRPLVWTLHDMWAFAGARHYDADAASSVWRAGATSVLAAPGAARDWVERSTWLRKSRSWHDVPFEFVTPSRWLARALSASALFRDRSATVIPYALDLVRFRPCGRAFSRERLGLPADRPIICFGAQLGLEDPRKGGGLLLQALRGLPPDLLKRRPLVCVFGQSRPGVVPDVPTEISWFGAIQDERLLPLVYSAADVMVVPSVMDNLPQTGVEAQACGCPVVAFDVTGLPDVIEDRRTGYLAAAGSAASLAEGIAWVLADERRAEALGVEARRRAETLWSAPAVVAAYGALYKRMASRRT